MESSNVKITDKNMKQHDRYSTGDVDAQKIYLTNFSGELSTISREESKSVGYPMGSVAPFIIDHTGCPVIYTATVAERTKNIVANSKASLFMREVRRNHRIETGWRLGVMGDLLEIDDNEDLMRVRRSYFRHYPKAAMYENFHEFKFYRLNVKMARVILGFGRIAWVEGDVLRRASVFDENTEQKIIEHMNQDHIEAMEKYLAQNDVKLQLGVKPEMVAVNQFGVTISYHNHLHFIAFEEEALDANAARIQLVKMAKA
ncbi:HugZ family protein [Phocoenobacter skyensis]|uniref:DUF2470 domain-containing protein n=1 Tax=Phocoenobacter skyensis TaxID=97481 RepID=A0A1H7XYC0_9PAST|nr:DUF2470 domain-containing protein [Pasteurella skyensis]MDP8079799.1 DUF2470 domain-containing protein [Pasteurella skyensis]MDP8085732.1 DUF2470 domain-containing protein [Pasteurella skyensis]MDP8185560.1 DUF2470 domain-containing protein [Pasteurella skyensis]QLB21820.1 hypothetical protein A6B44_00775 [Pasteurella skyensis]SEM38922.1 hypothetical protein SAMN05444853_11524 [Pasteurella skyensis]